MSNAPLVGPNGSGTKNCLPRLENLVVVVVFVVVVVVVVVVAVVVVAVV